MEDYRNIIFRHLHVQFNTVSGLYGFAESSHGIFRYSQRFLMQTSMREIFLPENTAVRAMQYTRRNSQQIQHA